LPSVIKQCAMLTSMSAFVPSEILHDWQSSSRQQYNVSIAFQSSLIKSYAESKLSNQIFVSIYKGDLLVSCISVCVNTTLHHLSSVPYIPYCNSLWSSAEVARWCQLFATRWHNFL